MSRLSTIALFGKLREHELELNRLKEQETFEKKVKSITLKSSAQKKDLSEDKEDSNQNETLSLLIKKFNIFLKKKNYERFQPIKRYAFKHNEYNYANYTCSSYGKAGHIKVDSPSNQNKDKSYSRQGQKL